MAIDKNMLIKLYSIALEEARHRDRLYTQTWMAVAIAGSVFLAAAGLFLKQQPSIISECYMTAFKIGLVSLGTCLAFFFTYSVFRLARERKICWEVAEKIEGVWMGNKEGLEDLFVRRKISKIPEKCRRICWAFSCREQGWRWVYPGTIFLAWIAFCIFLFICID